MHTKLSFELPDNFGKEGNVKADTALTVWWKDGCKLFRITALSCGRIFHMTPYTGASNSINFWKDLFAKILHATNDLNTGMQ